MNVDKIREWKARPMRSATRSELGYMVDTLLAALALKERMLAAAIEHIVSYRNEIGYVRATRDEIRAKIEGKIKEEQSDKDRD